MDKEELKNMADNPDFIPGIYNYCDRWCERCAFTSNCFLFATEKKQLPNDESHDTSNEEFWNQMGEVFKLTIELLEDTAKELGIGLNDIDTTAKEKNEAQKEKRAQQHSAAQCAHEYAIGVNGFFNKSGTLFDQKGEELTEMAALEIPGLDPFEHAIELSDFIEVIQWYQYLIPAKINRALRGKMDDLEFKSNPIQNDHNGSAKVALIGVDRSIAAWGGLLNVFPEEEDDILPMLVILEQIRTQTEEEFPDARAFIRPGFDGKL